MLLLNLLVSQGVITELESRSIEQDLEADSNKTIDDVLAAHNVSDVAVLTARNALFNIPVYNGNGMFPDKEAYQLLPKEKAEKYKAVPVELSNSELKIGVVDPDFRNVLEALQFMFAGSDVVYSVHLITPKTFRDMFEGYDKVEGANDKTRGNKNTEASDTSDDELQDITDVSIDVATSDLEFLPIPKLTSIMLKRAIMEQVSDIHVEHVGDRVRVRLRLDGELNTIFTLPPEMHSSFLARLKIMSGMRLDEKRKPQDGRFSVKFDGHKIDFRVSTLPSYYGEKIVLRILDSYRGVRALEDLGLSIRNLKLVKDAIAKPYGMILISGPTGSGKTTTLYSMLNMIDRNKRNVVSLEDPVEYNMPNMNQSQIFPEIGYTFANGLRSILRQDPDVIMVGEIRDAETAQLAIQAALTGHLVFSTIHTNDSVGVVTRLMDMGVDPYLIAPTLNLCVAQRLVKRICPSSESPLNDDPALAKMVQEQFADYPEEYKTELNLNRRLNEAIPSPTCPAGVKGRMPVFEMFNVTKEVERVILERKGEQELYKVIRKDGFMNMREDAIIKCMDGLIPFVEINSL